MRRKSDCGFVGGMNAQQLQHLEQQQQQQQQQQLQLHEPKSSIRRRNRSLDRSNADHLEQFSNSLQMQCNSGHRYTTSK